MSRACMLCCLVACARCSNVPGQIDCPRSLIRCCFLIATPCLESGSRPLPFVCRIPIPRSIRASPGGVSIGRRRIELQAWWPSRRRWPTCVTARRRLTNGRTPTLVGDGSWNPNRSRPNRSDTPSHSALKSRESTSRDRGRGFIDLGTRRRTRRSTRPPTFRPPRPTWQPPALATGVWQL